MNIFISAGEASSDIHGAHLVAELKKAAGADCGPVRAWGLGGDRLAGEGVELLMHNREFSVGGGPLEVISKIPLRSRLEKLVEAALFARRPTDLAVLVDSGELNLRLASLLHFFGVPVVYFIPPKVWVWRHSRIEDIEHHVDLVLSILPFEEPIYRHWEIPFEYVGNPLIDEVDASMCEADAKRALGIAPERRVLTVLAGSRHNEVKHHAGIFGQGVRRFLETLPPGEPRPLVLLPAAQAIEPEVLRQAFESELKGSGVELLTVKGRSHECLRAARAALVKSGTSTLEAALIGTPMVLAYHSSRSSEWLYRHVVRYRGFVGLVNLFLAPNAEDALGWGKSLSPVVSELVLGACTPERIGAELARVWADGPERETMLGELARTRELLMPPHASGDPERSPMRRAARATLELFKRTRNIAERSSKQEDRASE